ncbi:MAG: tRNA (adenosine(37)-N6)-dimethylallyltransferase MiaA [Candidatus Saccharimonadales bacterium]
MQYIHKPIIVIVGQTASGKSALAIKVAELFGGEIICADSRTIYKGMDIGTAKPSAQDRQKVPHHGLDLIEPTEYFSAAAFKDYAAQKVDEIQSRGKLPLIVGGTGLYIDGYVYDYSFAGEADRLQRAELEALSLAELQARARAMGIGETQIDFKNHRHLSRAVERGNITPERHPLPAHVLIIGLKLDREQLLERITNRVDTMFAMGFMQEVQNLVRTYGNDATGLLTPGYTAARRYLLGKVTLEEAKEEFKRSDRSLAKRQLTWFKRNQDIVSVHSDTQAIDTIRAFLLMFDTIDL